MSHWLLRDQPSSNPPKITLAQCMTLVFWLTESLFRQPFLHSFGFWQSHSAVTQEGLGHSCCNNYFLFSSFAFWMDSMTFFSSMIREARSCGVHGKIEFSLQPIANCAGERTFSLSSFCILTNWGKGPFYPPLPFSVNSWWSVQTSLLCHWPVGDRD